MSTTWREARELLLQSYEYKADTSLQSIDDLDILICYEEHANKLIQEHDEQYRKAEKTRRRRARKARDGFRALLAELEASGAITDKSTWQSTLRLVEKEPAYTDLCGMPGSSPLDLWMDAVDDMGEAVALARDKFDVATRKAGKKVELGMELPAFAELIKELGMASSIDETTQQLLLEDVRGRRTRSEWALLTCLSADPRRPAARCRGRKAPCRAQATAHDGRSAVRHQGNQAAR